MVFLTIEMVLGEYTLVKKLIIKIYFIAEKYF